jgi:hypothetical protein
MIWIRSHRRRPAQDNDKRSPGSPALTRSQVNIGVALIDAGAGPEMARWLVGVLGAANRAYLPTAVVEFDRRRTSLHFGLDGRELAFVAARPGAAKWLRIYADGSHDDGPVGAAPQQTIQQLFDWLLDDADSHA